MRYSRYLPTSRRVLALSLTVAAAAAARPAAAQVPGGWQAFTDGSHDYDIRADGARRDGGQGFAGATIRATVASPRGSGMLAQSIRADSYRGKRVRLSGFAKTVGVDEGSAALFLRVDGAGKVLTSDYMQNRPIMATTDWTRQELVVDVPANAIGITFGFFLSGSGQSWLDDVAIDVVSDAVPVTGRPGGLYAELQQPSARELERRRRDQEVAYRRLPFEGVNLALRQTDAGSYTVASVVREP